MKNYYKFLNTKYTLVGSLFTQGKFIFYLNRNISYEGHRINVSVHRHTLGFLQKQPQLR